MEGPHEVQADAAVVSPNVTVYDRIWWALPLATEVLLVLVASVTCVRDGTCKWSPTSTGTVLAIYIKTLLAIVGPVAASTARHRSRLRRMKVLSDDQQQELERRSLLRYRVRIAVGLVAVVPFAFIFSNSLRPAIEAQRAGLPQFWAGEPTAFFFVLTSLAFWLAFVDLNAVALWRLWGWHKMLGPEDETQPERMVVAILDDTDDVRLVPLDKLSGSDVPAGEFGGWGYPMRTINTHAAMLTLAVMAGVAWLRITGGSLGALEHLIGLVLATIHAALIAGLIGRFSVIHEQARLPIRGFEFLRERWLTFGLAGAAVIAAISSVG